MTLANVMTIIDLLDMAKSHTFVIKNELKMFGPIDLSSTDDRAKRVNYNLSELEASLKAALKMIETL